MPHLPARPTFVRQTILLMAGAALSVALFIVGEQLPLTVEHDAVTPETNVQARPTTSGSLPRSPVRSHRRKYLAAVRTRGHESHTSAARGAAHLQIQSPGEAHDTIFGLA